MLAYNHDIRVASLPLPLLQQGAVPCGERCRCVDCKNAANIYGPDAKQRIALTGGSGGSYGLSSSGGAGGGGIGNNNVNRSSM